MRRPLNCFLLLSILNERNRKTTRFVDHFVSVGAGGELGGKQWSILCLALLVALGTGFGVGVPLALRSGGSVSLQERISEANAILAQVPLIDGYIVCLFRSESLGS